MDYYSGPENRRGVTASARSNRVPSANLIFSDPNSNQKIIINANSRVAGSTPVVPYTWWGM